ncbi:hypothetical protein VTN00DRAFT_3163 [Thermoascus crustaceus]|uniref:uncharacterized protein n=1 Tax=Thermoascus crustaceus TaxID=5088 RepID=UPI003743196D
MATDPDPETVQTASRVAGSVGLFLTALLTTPALCSIAGRFILGRRQQNGYQPVQEGYEDEDGVATPESVKAFLDKPQRIGIACLSAAGFLVSLALAVVTMHRVMNVQLVEYWLRVGDWVFLSVQAVSIWAERSPTKRFALGRYGFIASVFPIAIPIIELYIWWSSYSLMPFDDLQKPLIIAQLVVAFLQAFLYILLPRRPDVFKNGKLVDQQSTVSFLSRTTFSWADTVLKFTMRNRSLDIDDLPELHNAMRSKTLRSEFDNVKGSRRLWKTLIRAHFPVIVEQLLLTLVASVMNFAPQVALLGILRSLEARDTGDWEPWQTWVWVFALGVLMLVSSTIEARLYWVVYSDLGIPVLEQLSAVIFAKSMRRKDVKNMKKGSSKETELTDSGNPDGCTSNGHSKKATADEEDEEGDLQKTRQGIINLVAVDSRRVSEFATYDYVIPWSILKLLIACGFLVKLIGWIPLLSGLAVSALVTPINILVAGKYTTAQESLMKYRDQKLAVVTEVLQGIRQIKFSALEGQWQKKVAEVRNTELKAQWMAFLYDVGLISIWILGPLMLSAVSLAVYALIHGELTASVAFTAISVFGSLELALAILPELISNFLEAWVSAGRIEKYLDSPEKTANTVPADSISFEEADVAWPADEEVAPEERYALRNLNLKFPSKGFSVISGKTGSGKSLLLASILGECDILSGVVKVPVPPPLDARHDDKATPANWIIESAIAYVAQIPWIENATIKDNILFGLPYDPVRYQKVLFACALEKDLEMLEDGELTDIGANGVNLSGGQKWRMSFARALYSRAGILIMDDLFSAVDAHTGRHLYEHALTGELAQNRTRILVTHHVALCLPRTDYFVSLEDGSVKHAGTVEELRRTNNLADILVQEQEAEAADVESEDEDLSNGNGVSLQKVVSNRSHRSSIVNGNGEATKRAAPKKFVEEEKRETGAISLSIYKEYFKTGGGIPFWVLVVTTYVGFAALLLGRSWWVNIWTSSSSARSTPEHYLLTVNQPITQTVTTGSNDNLFLYLGVYVVLSVTACVAGSARYYFVLSAAIRASRNLFDHLIFAVLRAPLRWLDTVPVGRILNRFTADFHLIDSRLGYDIALTAYRCFEVMGIIVAGVLVSPVLIIFALVLLAACLNYAIRFLAGAREVKRLESNAKSPIFEQFGSALNGLGTIRAFNKAEIYVERMYEKIDRHARAWWHMWLFNRWLSYRMNVAGAIFSTITAALVVSIKGVSASLAGFALSFALQYTTSMAMSLRQYANMELDMNATERVVEYSNIAIENQGGADAPAAWPTEGRLEVRDLVVGYADDLPPVLKGLTFTVEKNQRVGVVGRTGAGKSSLTLALFRFLEAREGAIYIDGIDVSKIKLHDLRSRLAIIPQDPVLFSGTVRSNLDPFGEYSDDELYDALERVHLISGSGESTVAPPSPATPKGIEEPLKPEAESPSSSSSTARSSNGNGNNSNIFSSLSSPISEGGLNLSQGQRQLLCLARAIVCRPKIMVLDEATSAVDMSTDALIQRSIRCEFGHNATTLLVIAHRLSTIVDFDRILVMDAGKAVEFGSPRELMRIEDGVFKKLVEESGERRVLEEIIFGGEEQRVEE